MCSLLSGAELRHVKAARCYAVAFCSGDKRTSAHCVVLVTQTGEETAVAKECGFNAEDWIDTAFVSQRILCSSTLDAFWNLSE